MLKRNWSKEGLVQLFCFSFDKCLVESHLASVLAEQSLAELVEPKTKQSSEYVRYTYRRVFFLR